jgi:hypothetical protein
MSLASIHADIVGARNNVIIPRVYIRFLNGDYTAALILEEIIYASAHATDNDGWFSRTATEWRDECLVSRKQVGRALGIANQRAAERGAESDLVETSVRKVRLPDGRLSAETATHYRLSHDAFEAIFAPDRGNSGNEPLGNSGNEPLGNSGNEPLGNSLSIETGKETGVIGDVSPSPRRKEAPKFTEFYEQAYPRRVAREAAWKAWQKIKPSDDLADQIIGAARLQSATTYKHTDPQYIPHPSKWLNAEQWEDEIQGKGRKAPNGGARLDSMGRPLPTPEEEAELHRQHVEGMATAWKR